jgi:hypothetical protein
MSDMPIHGIEIHWFAEAFEQQPVANRVACGAHRLQLRLARIILMTVQFQGWQPTGFCSSQTLAAGRVAVTLPCIHGGFCSALVRIAWPRDVRS